MDKWCSQCNHFTYTGNWRGICQKGIIEGEMWSQTATHAQSCSKYGDKYVKPIIVLQPDDSDLYRDGVAAGRRQAQAEATEGRWKGER